MNQDLLSIEENLDRILSDRTEQIDGLLRERGGVFYKDQIFAQDAVRRLFKADQVRDLLHICEGLFVIGVVMGIAFAANGLLHLLLG